MCQGYGMMNAIIVLSLGHSGMVPYMYFYLCSVIFIYILGFTSSMTKVPKDPPPPLDDLICTFYPA